MTYQSVAFAICEAGALDIRGNVSMIGVLPYKVGVPELPTSLQPWMCGVFEQDEPEPALPGAPLDVTIRVIGPDNDTLFLTRQDIVSTGQPPGERHRVQIALPIPLQLPAAGDYAFVFQMRAPLVDRVEDFVVQRVLTIFRS